MAIKEITFAEGEYPLPARYWEIRREDLEDEARYARDVFGGLAETLDPGRYDVSSHNWLRLDDARLDVLPAGTGRIIFPENPVLSSMVGLYGGESSGVMPGDYDLWPIL